ncbi:MAG: hypothetical protein C4532_05765 [Candidatus Abyssobacteria bacterium SURF_17]|jgi:hypothetical protein|uniref:Iron-only hydrogenase system regulator n=1 Tax=Candidatus Abyssobacteria bacterium SURF_17 TaxID=2093361 RepID=A0A419F2D8_9BACT|nr:MAG: hypothetical protein C4532_05765 [Candidatus Abyssubacteria bacterium SURF_17]
MAKRIILGVQISNRVKSVPDVQKVLTEFGCNIKTRLGLHEVDDKSCSTVGLVILETFGPEKQVLALENRLKKIKGIKVRKMTF